MGVIVRKLPRPFASRAGRCAKGRALGAAAGQMTVELVVALPVLLTVALVVVNAMLYLSECAAFDRLARQEVRACATSPAYGQDADTCAALVAQQLEAQFDRPYVSTEVSQAEEGGLRTYRATLRFSPTLFGMGLRSEVLGVRMPQLSHAVSYSVQTYKAGVIA